MKGRRIGRFLGFVAIAAVVATVLFGRTFDGERLFVPMHTDEFLPWRSDLTDAEREAITAGSNTGASDKLISFRADDAVTVAAMREGKLPLWNPYNAGGVPHLGQGLYGVFYPFHALYRWFEPERVYGLLAALHHLLAALFTYLYLRGIGARPIGAAFGGLAFGFSTCLLARTHYYQYLETFAWMPLGLLLVERWFRKRSRTALFTLAPLTALVLLSGWPQTAVFTIYTWILLALCHAMRRDLKVEAHRVIGALALAIAVCAGASFGIEDHLLIVAFGPMVALLLVFLVGRDRAAFVRRMAALGGVLALGGGVAMVQYLPVAEWLEFGTRKPGAPELLVGNSLRPRFLLEAFVPNMFGDPSFALTEHYLNLARAFALSPSDFVSGHTPGSVIENAAYFGIATALLAPLGIAFRSPRRGYLLIVLLIYGAFSIGVSYVVYPTFFSGFFVGTDARRAVVVPVFAACCLAGLGLSGLVRRPRRAVAMAMGWLLVGAAVLIAASPALDDATLLRPFTDHAATIANALSEPLDIPEDKAAANAEHLRGCLTHAGGAIIAAAIALLLSLRFRRLGTITLLAVLGTDLVVAARPHVAPKPADRFLEAHPLIEHLQNRTGRSGRIGHYVVSPERLKPTEIPLSPNMSANFGLLDAFCYTVSPPRRWNQLAQSIHVAEEGDLPDAGGAYVDPLSDPTHLAHRALDLMAVRAILGSGPIPEPLPDGVTLDAQFGESWVLKNDRALPRVFTVAEVEDANDYSPEKIVLSRLRAENFDPRRRVLVEGKPIPAASAFDAGRLPTATLVDDERERLRVTLDGGESGGVLVILDGYAPGWKAFVDGAPTDVLIADYAFRAVPFPAGAREVELRYEPRGVKIGSMVSAGSAGLMVLLLLIGVLRDLVSAFRRRRA